MYTCVFCLCSAETSENPEVVERSYGSLMLEKLTGSEDGRIDHVLQVCFCTIIKKVSKKRIGLSALGCIFVL